MKDGKGGPLSETDLEFLGYLNVKPYPNVKNEQDFGLPEHCRVFCATASAGISHVNHWFVYLLAECTNDDLKKVESQLKDRRLFENETCYIVVPKTLSKRPAFKSLKRAIESPMEAHVFEELMWTKISQAFDKYMNDTRDQIKYFKTGISYIEPPISIESATCKEQIIVEPIKHFVDFFSSDSGDSDSRAGITVVNAEAGVGKPTLAVMIANELAQQWKELRVIPILLRGQKSWRDLEQKLQADDNLWDIMQVAFRSEEVEFPLSDETLFRHLMRQGYIALIFDGFDELRAANLSPQANFEWLGDIADKSSARLMVTTRTTFWAREVGSPETPHQMYKLNPFGEKEAKKYFEKKFEEDDAGRMKAVQFYKILVSGTTGDVGFHFVNLPDCADMIAEYVENGGSNLTLNSTEQRSMIKEFLFGILARERERQEIATGTKDIWKVFGDVAISFSEFEIEDLESAGLEERDRDSIRDHAFLNPINGRINRYSFKSDFLLHYLRAWRIFEELKRLGGQEFVRQYKSDLRKLIETDAYGTGVLSDQMANLAREEELNRIGEAHQFCLEENDKHNKLKSFFFHVVAKTVALHSHGRTCADRAEEIFNYLGAEGKIIHHLSVQGSIADLALTSWTIKNSHFSDLTMIKCDTDKLVFHRCRFIGNLDIGDLDRLNVEFKDCTGKDTAELAVSRQPNSKDNLRKYLKIALQRFQGRHFRGIEEDNWKKGNTRNIEEHFGLFNLMKHAGLIGKEHQHRPVWRIENSEIGNVRDFIENGMPKGAVKKVFEQMQRKEKKSLSQN